MQDKSDKKRYIKLNTMTS